MKVRLQKLFLVCLISIAALDPRCAAQEPRLGEPVPADPSSEDWNSLLRLVKEQGKILKHQERRIHDLERTSSTIQPVAGKALVTGDARALDESPTATTTPHAAFASPTSPFSGMTQVPIHVGGQYRIMGNGNSFPFHADTISDDQESRGFANQRFRTWLTVAPNEHVEGYLQVEMGHIFFGQNFEFPKTYVGPRFPPSDDRVGIELRRGYLTFQAEEVGRFRVGIQDWTDSFGQTLASADWDFNVGGVSWLRTFQDWNNLRFLLGSFFMAENALFNGDNAYLFTFDVDQPLSEHWSTGFSAYYVPDRFGYSYPTVGPYRSAWDVWLGWRLRGEFAAVPWNTFVIWNSGERENLGAAPVFTHSGAATKLEVGPIGFGPGKASLQALYSTGGRQGSNRSAEFRTIAQSVRDNFGSQGYWSYLPLTSPDGPSDVSDLGVSLQNRGLGLFTVQGKYEYPIHGRLSGQTAVGWLRSAVRNPTSQAIDMGIEVAQLFTLDLTGNLKLDFGAAYLFAGDFYRAAPVGPRPDNLFELFARMQLEF